MLPRTPEPTCSVFSDTLLQSCLNLPYAESDSRSQCQSRFPDTLFPSEANHINASNLVTTNISASTSSGLIMTDIIAGSTVIRSESSPTAYASLTLESSNCHSSQYNQVGFSYPSYANRAFWPPFYSPAYYMYSWPPFCSPARYTYLCNSQFIGHHLTNTMWRLTHAPSYPLFCVVPLQQHLSCTYTDGSSGLSRFPVLASSVRNSDVQSKVAVVTQASSMLHGSVTTDSVAECTMTSSRSTFSATLTPELTLTSEASRLAAVNTTNAYSSSSADVKFSLSDGSMATDMTEFKATGDSNENSGRDSGGVEVSAPSNTSLVTSGPTEPGVLKVRKAVVTPVRSLTPVQLSLIKLATSCTSEVPKVQRRMNSTNMLAVTSVKPTDSDRKVKRGQAGLTVMFHPQLPASTTADTVPQLDGSLNSVATTSVIDKEKGNRISTEVEKGNKRKRKEKGNRIGTKVVCNPAAALSFVPKWSSSSHISPAEGQCQLSTGKQMSAKCQKNTAASNSVNSSVPHIRPKLSVDQPFIAFVPATDTQISVQSKPLSKSQRKRRNKAARRAELADSRSDLSSVQKVLTLGHCTAVDNSETERSKRSNRRQKMRKSKKQCSEKSNQLTASVQSSSNYQFQFPSQMQISSTKVSSSKERISGKMAHSPSTHPSSPESPTQLSSTSSVVKSINDDQRIVSSTSTSCAATDKCENSQNNVATSMSISRVEESSFPCISESFVSLITPSVMCSNGVEQHSSKIQMSSCRIEVTPAVCRIPDSIDCKASVSCGTANSIVNRRNTDAGSNMASVMHQTDDETEYIVIDVDETSDNNTEVPEFLPEILLSPYEYLRCASPADCTTVSSDVHFSSTDAITDTVSDLIDTEMPVSRTIPALDMICHTVPSFPSTAGVSRHNRNRKFSQAGLSTSEAIVIDDDDDFIVVDEVSSEKTGLDMTCHTAFTMKKEEMAVKQPAVSLSSCNVPAVAEIPLGSNGKATDGQPNLRLPSIPLFHSSTGVSRHEAKTQSSPAGLSSSEAVVNDDEDFIIVDEVSTEKTYMKNVEALSVDLSKNLHPAASVSKVLSCVSGVTPKNSHSSSTLQTQICSSSRRVKISCSPVRHYRTGYYRSRPHPYHNQISTRSNSFIATSRKYSNLTALLQCHTICLYKHRSFAQRPVKPYILEEEIDPGKPAFASYTGMQRSTQAVVERILGKATTLPCEDDKADAIFTASDLEQFDDRKRLAIELDKIFGDVIVID